MNIREYTIEELENLCISLGEAKYRAKQVFEWLHNKGIYDLREATNLSKSLVEKISQNCDIAYPTIKNEYISNIDDTKKYLIKLSDNSLIESVLMKYKYGYTVCVSSQVGCNMGCKFCASTKNGLIRNLKTYEMLAQIYLISKANNINISNIVVMGSGEPLQNLDNLLKFLKLVNDKDGKNISLRNITVSTCGIVENIDKLSKLKLPITLALSLHAPSDDIRHKIMPISKKYKLDDVMTSMKNYFISTNRRITFEYCMIDSLNSSRENAKELVELFNKNFNNCHVDFNVNLIPVNSIKECEFQKPGNKTIIDFMKVLTDKGINVTLRRELGKDISGSCGQLRASVN